MKLERRNVIRAMFNEVWGNAYNKLYINMYFIIYVNLLKVGVLNLHEHIHIFDS